MKAMVPFNRKKLSPRDCTNMYFLGAPIYSYLHADQSSEKRKKCPFVFEDGVLRASFSLGSFSISDQSHKKYRSLFVLPKCILLSNERCHHTLVPGFSFRTPEPLRKALMLGDQVVCVTKHAIYFLPGYVVKTDFIDTDHSSQELYILKDKTVEIYSRKREVFGIDIDGVLRIRCTMNPRAVVLATKYDVFLVDLVRKVSRHLVSTNSYITDIVYDSSEPAASGECSAAAGCSTSPDVCTSIRDEEMLKRALETEEPAGGIELLYLLSHCRLTLLYMQTRRSRSIGLPYAYAFKMKVSRSHVILTHLDTLVFLSKSLTRFSNVQTDFDAFGCNRDVLAFAKDDLTIINKRKFVFRMGDGWEYTSRMFRMAGYYRLRSAYSRRDYDDYPLGDAEVGGRIFADALGRKGDAGSNACTNHGGDSSGAEGNHGYMEQLCRRVCGGKKIQMRIYKTKRKPLKKVVDELKGDLCMLERKYDDMILRHELEMLCAPRGEKEADAEVHNEFVLFALVRKDYRDLYLGKEKEVVKRDSGRLATKKYNSSSQRRRGFM